MITWTEAKRALNKERHDGIDLAAMVINMKRGTISKPLVFSPEQMAAALDAAPERINDPDCPYDPNDAAAVDAFWSQAKVRLPGQRGAQKAPVKVAVTVRYSPDVLDWFKQTGDGWQTRMDEALRDYIAQHKAA